MSFQYGKLLNEMCTSDDNKRARKEADTDYIYRVESSGGLDMLESSDTRGDLQ